MLDPVEQKIIRNQKPKKCYNAIADGPSDCFPLLIHILAVNVLWLFFFLFTFLLSVCLCVCVRLFVLFVGSPFALIHFKLFFCMHPIKKMSEK